MCAGAVPWLREDCLSTAPVRGHTVQGAAGTAKGIGPASAWCWATRTEDCALSDLDKSAKAAQGASTRRAQAASAMRADRWFCAAL